MLPVGFEPTISAGERPQTYTLDRAAIGTGSNFLLYASISTLYYLIAWQHMYKPARAATWSVFGFIDTLLGRSPFFFFDLILK